MRPWPHQTTRVRRPRLADQTWEFVEDVRDISVSVEPSPYVKLAVPHLCKHRERLGRYSPCRREKDGGPLWAPGKQERVRERTGARESCRVRCVFLPRCREPWVCTGADGDPQANERKKKKKKNRDSLVDLRCLESWGFGSPREHTLRSNIGTSWRAVASTTSLLQGQERRSLTGLKSHSSEAIKPWRSDAVPYIQETGTSGSAEGSLTQFAGPWPSRAAGVCESCEPKQSSQAGPLKPVSFHLHHNLSLWYLINILHNSQACYCEHYYTYR